jgi:hypothetical protein
LKPPTDVIIEDTIPLEPDLIYKAYPTKILDQQDRVTRNKTTQFYKVLWNGHSEDEVTWEHEEFLQSNYPTFFCQGNHHQTSLAFTVASISG